jgi:hypothetical protein
MYPDELIELRQGAQDRGEKQMTEQELKLQARLAALEYLVANLYHDVHRVARSTPGQIQAAHEHHEQVREVLSHATIPGVDLAQSDQFVAEVQAAVENIMTMIELMAGMQKTSKSPRPRTRGRRMSHRPAGHPELWGDSGSYQLCGIA